MTRAAYSPAEAAALLGISRSTIYVLIDSGDLARVKVGRRTLIPAVEIDRLLDVRTAPDSPPPSLRVVGS